MRLILQINDLDREEVNFLLPRINLIRDKVHTDLEVRYTDEWKGHSNWINIDQEINNIDKALLLFKLFNNLHYNKDNVKILLTVGMGGILNI